MTGPELAAAALSLAQWVSADRDAVLATGHVHSMAAGPPVPGASPDFDADELPEFSNAEVQAMSAKGKAGAEAGKLLHKLFDELSEDGDAAAEFKQYYGQSFADFVSDGRNAEALDFMLEWEQRPDEADETLDFRVGGQRQTGQRRGLCRAAASRRHQP